MKCGRCKSTGVDTDHVRACYGTPQADPVEVTQPASNGPQAPPEAINSGFERQQTSPGRGHQTEVRPSLFVDVDDHATSYYRSGMDADGMTPRLRQLEDEYGYDGMLYLWRDES
jgi:hypothetical protein